MDYYSKYLKYKNKYISLRNNIGGAIPVPNAEYILMGHSCDLMNNVVDITNPNKYITSVICGQENGVYLNWDIYNELLEDRTKTLIGVVIAAKENPTQTQGTYHIADANGPLATYIDNSFTPLLDTDSDQILLARSGVIQVNLIRDNSYSTMIGINDQFEMMVFEVQFNNDDTSQIMVLNKPFDYSPNDVSSQIRKIVELAYYGSVYPTIEEVLLIFDEVFKSTSVLSKEQAITKFKTFKKIVVKKYIIQVSELFKKIPGTYLNQGCRLICGEDTNPLTDEQKAQVELRKEYSSGVRSLV